MIALGADHAGYELKEGIKAFLDELQIEYKDFGCYSKASVDYPMIAKTVGEAVAAGECEKGILCCGTGVGISIAANKVKGVRCACCDDYFSVLHTRLHNDANVLALGGRVVGQGTANMLVELFLKTEFEGGRHQRRVDLISDIEADR